MRMIYQAVLNALIRICPAMTAQYAIKGFSRKQRFQNAKVNKMLLYEKELSIIKAIDCFCSCL